MKELDPTKSVQLRNGRQVRNVCWDFIFSDGTPGIAAIVREKDHDLQIAWNNRGRYYRSLNTMSEFDLINVPEQIEGWTLYFRNNADGNIIAEFSAKKMTKYKNVYLTFIACLPTSLTVGEGLD